MFMINAILRAHEACYPTEIGSEATTDASPHRPSVGHHPFALQSLRVAAKKSFGNVCISPASTDAVVRVLAESMQPRARVTTLQQLDPSRGPLEPQTGAGYEMRSGTAVFIDGRAHFSPVFAQRAIDRGIHLERAPGALVNAKEKINAFTAEHSLGLIPNVFDEAMLEGKHCLLVNAIGFKGTWENRFLLENTKRDYVFFQTPTRTIPCTMMFQYSPTILINEASDYLSVSLGYETANTQPRAEFSAFMPKEDVSVDDVLTSLQRSGFPKIYESESLECLGLPKFDYFQCHNGLMADAAASGLTTLQEPLHITTGIGQEVDEIAQIVTMKVDEEGCVAAAVTFAFGAPIGAVSSIKKRSIIFDRPFAFFIRMGEEPRHVLFAGIFNGAQ